MDLAQTLFGYRIVHLNIRGVRSNKRNLERYLALNNYPEIVTLNETKLGTAIKFEQQGYYCATRREPTDKGGKHGSMIMVRDTIGDVVELDELRIRFRDEVIGIEIKGNTSRPSFNVVTYYNPPGGGINARIFKRDLYPGVRTVITGDLNSKNLVWGSNSTDASGKFLLETLDDQNWILLNDGSKTRYDPASGKEEVLDVVVCTPGSLDLFREFYVGEDDVGSDHYPLHADFVFGHPSNSPIFYRAHSQTDWTRFEQSVAAKLDQLPQNPQTAVEIDEVATRLTAILNEAFEEACPLKKRRENQAPWNPEIEALVKHKRKLRREKSRANKRGDIGVAADKQRESNRTGVEIHRLQEIEKKREHEGFCRDLNTEKNPRRFFDSVGRVFGERSKTDRIMTRKIKDELGNMATTAQERVDLFASRLEHVHQTPD